ncbi:MAG: membrane protein insertion efficiency factor YidD [Clostridia bacterium]|nr:membrane protein insertion efficiency factor YidD [Clostridia bacterium]
MKYVCIFLIRLYQKYISPLIGPHCRFRPTCSQYALEAYGKHGFFKGTVLTVWRILRCNPFGRAGYDPVPDCFPKRKDR